MRSRRYPFEMKLPTPGISLVCLSLSIVLSLSSEAGFRGWEFGEDFQSITQKEAAEFERTTATAAVFHDDIFGLRAKVIYQFSPETDGLIGGSYDFNCNGFEIEELLDHYMKVKSVFDARYGASMKSCEVWWNNESDYKNDPVNAFRFGDVSFRSEWFGPGVIVIITLRNELNTQGRFVYTINYRPGRNYNRIEDEAKL